MSEDKYFHGKNSRFGAECDPEGNIFGVPLEHENTIEWTEEAIDELSDMIIDSGGDILDARVIE